MFYLFICFAIIRLIFTNILYSSEMKVKSQVALDKCYNTVKDGKPPHRLKKYLFVPVFVLSLLCFSLLS